ncbi:hypothetical protein EDC04DRAFT_2715287 [Pisolithus marmoratus]|nr:hypothetical protein EDC04DRAFT_2715287 [Pisolithus marmoratus]
MAKESIVCDDSQHHNIRIILTIVEYSIHRTNTGHEKWTWTVVNWLLVPCESQSKSSERQISIWVVSIILSSFIPNISRLPCLRAMCEQDLREVSTDTHNNKMIGCESHAVHIVNARPMTIPSSVNCDMTFLPTPLTPTIEICLTTAKVMKVLCITVVLILMTHTCMFASGDN